MSYRKVALLVIAIAALAFSAGYWLSERGSPPRSDESADSRVLHYICPMHPQYISDRPGDCPSCGMRLVPVYGDDAHGTEGAGQADSSAHGSFPVSPDKLQVAGVRTSRIQKTPATHTIRTVGRVEPDERRVYRINAALDGWVRATYSNSTGGLVQRDERLATVYSPDYRNAQTAFLTALNTRDRVQQTLKESPEQAANVESQLRAVENNVQLYTDSLLNLGVGEKQLEELSRTRQYTENVHIYAPATGFVLARNVSDGQRFVRGEELYRIADLSRVWILADLFEHESRFVRAGQTVKVSYQGRDYHAKVSEVLPQFDPESRTLKVRLETDNLGYVLRPDMFVDVEFPIELPPAVAVPADAIIDSGLRKTVFVDRGNGYFEPRLIQTGWRFGSQVEVTEGLEAGEEIVVEGNFLLDSESRMKAAATGIQAPARDPVCGMDVDQLKAKAAGRTSEYGGKTYYFCSDLCKQQFDKNPQSYRGRKDKAGEPQAGSAIDPVCGMSVDIASARHKSVHGGKTYYFCNESCKKSFDKDPRKYIKKKDGAARSS